MAFTYNGTEPTAITYNGTSLNVLQYGSTAVWGKPFSLTTSAGANTTIGVNRISSPNQHASTGGLESGAKVYYGDVLQIDASADYGYTLSTFTVNGTAWTSGNTITVDSAITVVTSATQAQSWHTVWTGIYNKKKNFNATGSQSYSITNDDTTVTGVDWSLPTKLTFTATPDGISSSVEYIDYELEEDLVRQVGYAGSLTTYECKISIMWSQVQSKFNIYFNFKKIQSASLSKMIIFSLSEVKQYY